jgi:SAM-dependent methyltransferase
MSIWIGSPEDVRYGEAADLALEAVNDIRYWSDELGAVRADDARWSKMLQHKVVEQQSLDHNLNKIPRNVGRVLEINCGLHPRARELSRQRIVSSITLIDPLITEYQRDPRCPYSRMTPNPHLLAIDITEYNITEAFDTIIAVEFLERTKDAIEAINIIEKALRPHGIVIFTAATYDDLDPREVYDSGKPVRVKSKLIKMFWGRFNILDSYEEDGEYGPHIRFIGQRWN